ncbi:MAG TPA: VWA domain-containing protein [Anaerolineales bacterium]|nr:VWA domain-containing protein [Anaerolineales bacterium]
MSFLWAGSLFLLALIPLIVVLYVWLLRRRRRYTVRYSSLALVREAASHQSRWRRHLPFIVFLLAMTSLVMALARPVATVTVPSNKAAIIMAIDVSRSMCANDIPPNRLEAAKSAAQAFIRSKVEGRQIGIVAFAGFAELIQPSTDDVRLLESAVESLAPARRTAIGSAILRSIDAIAEVDDRVKPSDISQAATEEAPEAPEDYSPHIIVLLTDGASNAGPFPLTAAQQAVERGIRVYTIGFGTNSNSSVMDCGSQFQENEQFGGAGGGFGFGGGGGGGFRREIDEVTLRQIAELTGGSYHLASSASELEEVFQSLPNYLVTTRETIEISAFFTAIAAFLAILAMILSFLWHPLS